MKTHLLKSGLLLTATLLFSRLLPAQPACITFRGDGAKQIFNVLYPFTQGRVSTISADFNRQTAELDIQTPNIFCRVWTSELDSSSVVAQQELQRIGSDSFQCGYFVGSDGELSACSDQVSSSGKNN